MAGSPRLLQSMKKLVISISKPQMHSSSRSYSKKQATRSPGKQNAESLAANPTKLLMPGGMPPRLIRRDSQIVRSAVSVQARSLIPSESVAIQALSQTIIHLTKGGRFRQAADREKEIAQIYLQETNDLRKACDSFERAGEWYSQEDANA